MSTTHLFKSSVVALSLSVAAGIFIHDNNIDRLAVATIALPAAVVGAELITIAGMSDNLHPHSAEHSLSQATRDMQSQSPQVQPRDGREKKYRLTKAVPKGRHPFDNYTLPLIA